MIPHNRIWPGSFIALLLLLSMFACQKVSYLKTGGNLSFSTDTLSFDTVFTATGSVTRSFKIYNTNSKWIQLDRIRLSQGQNSVFRMNIDGQATKDISNVNIAPNDSVYVFVAVTINPTSGVTPFLIEDAVEITLNGISRKVQLEAYGQDAHYISDSVLQSQTWVNDKPYVIVHSALVDKDQILTIQKGCRIYMHQDSKLYVNGTLQVYGTKEDSVIFQGDRLDRDYFGYRDYPGEWRGIHFLGASSKSIISYAVIKNAGFSDAALYVQPPDFFDVNHPTVHIKNSIIANSLGYGILGFNAHIRADNCLVHTCGAQNLAIIQGGTYTINYCTFATYGGVGINHSQQPTAAILNYRDSTQTIYVGNPLNATITNTVFYGPLEDEIIFGKKTEWPYNVELKHCLIKRTTPLTAVVETNVIKNQDPLFADYYKWNFRPTSSSPLKAAGVVIPDILDDLNGNPRSAMPSIGCYEIQ